MKVILYQTSSDNEEVYKDLTEVSVLNDVHPLKPFDVKDPVIIISSLADAANCNYAYIEDWGRYYFVSPPIANNRLFELHMTCDVLSTFFNEVKNVPCIIDKESISNDLYINDGTFVQGVKNYTKVYNFSNGFNSSAKNILICAGGK